jgi:hypothetical protein
MKFFVKMACYEREIKFVLANDGQICILKPVFDFKFDENCFADILFVRKAKLIFHVNI